MGWFFVSAGMSCACFVLAWIVGAAPRGGPRSTVVAPWISIPAALLIAFGVPLVLANAWPSRTVSPWVVVFPVLASLLLVLAAGLVAVWLVARRKVEEGRCTSCGHTIASGQERCPECGIECRSGETRTLRTRLERIERDAPMALSMALTLQSLLLLAAFVTLAWIVVPTVRVVHSNRLSGTSSGTANLRSPTGQELGDAPYSYSTQVNATVLVPATFVGAFPGVGASIGLEVVVKGSVTPQPTHGEAMPPCSLDLSTLVGSRSDLIAFQNDLVGRTSILHLNPAQDPARHIYESFDLFAAGYWPAPDPTGKTPPPAMPAADIAKAPGALAPALMTVGVPTGVGVIAYGLVFAAARRRRGRNAACSGT